MIICLLVAFCSGFIHYVSKKTSPSFITVAIGETLSDFNNFWQKCPDVYWLEEMVLFPTLPCSYTTWVN